MKPHEFQQWREKLGLSQQALADNIGVSRGLVNLVERGERQCYRQQIDFDVILTNIGSHKIGFFHTNSILSLTVYNNNGASLGRVVRKDAVRTTPRRMNTFALLPAQCITFHYDWLTG
jgi:hypothetical protein